MIDHINYNEHGINNVMNPVNNMMSIQMNYDSSIINTDKKKKCEHINNTIEELDNLCLSENEHIQNIEANNINNKKTNDSVTNKISGAKANKGNNSNNNNNKSNNNKTSHNNKSNNNNKDDGSKNNNNNNNNNSNNFNDSSFNSDNNSDDGEEGGMDYDLSNESMRNLAAKTKMIITYCYKSCIFLNLLCKNYPNNILTSNTILSQIVTCLNCYFDYLVGPKCLNIKVKNMEQYNFRPQLWLTSIVESYLFLLNSDKEHEELLIREIANEGRYYKAEIFNKAYYICKREGLLHKEELNKFKNFCQEIVDMKDEVELFNDVDDIPDNFLDRS